MPQAMPTDSSNQMNRRDWLKTAGGLVVGFSLGGLSTFGEQAPAIPLSPLRRTAGRSTRAKSTAFFQSTPTVR